MESISRSQVLSECLTIFEARARSVSKNLANREAMDGYEKQFDLEQARCRIIREIMRDIEGGRTVSNEIRKPADWQTEIIVHPERALRMEL